MEMNLEEFTVRQRRSKRFYVDNELLECMAPILKPHGIAIYCVLAKHANSKTQRCWPAYETIMKQSGVGKRNTITKYLNLLQKHGLIAIRGVGRKNIYWLLDVSCWLINSGQKDTIRSHSSNSVITPWDIDIFQMDTRNNIPSNKEGAHTATVSHISNSDKSNSLKEVREIPQDDQIKRSETLDRIREDLTKRGIYKPRKKPNSIADYNG